MKNRTQKMLAGAALVASLFAVPAAIAAYTATIMNDGTTLWSWTSVSGQLVLQANTSPAALTIDPLGGPIAPISTVALLPTCAAALKGAIRMVSDATSPTYNAALTGGGAVIVPVACDGTAWKSH